MSPTDFVCTSCGRRTRKWFGRCPDCGAWSSAEQVTSAAPSSDLEVVSLSAAPARLDRLSSGLDELDRVLGGGLVPGSVVLLSGEPGVGKSTLILQLLDGVARAHAVLLITGEESVDQTSLRAARLGVDRNAVRVGGSFSLNDVLAACEREQPDVLVVDSIQTLCDSRLEQGPGSVVQVRECAAELVRHAKATGMAIVLVGHVTKDGQVAGPKTLEHVVDAVLSLEGERSGSIRLLRSVKNRFGSCDETGVFIMSPQGLIPVEDPSAMLLADRSRGLPGSVVFPALEGTRPTLVELQALVIPSDLPHPRRVAIGVDSGRLALLLGVLFKQEVITGKRDVFVSTAGGLAVREPGSDLPVCLALYSAASDRALDDRVVAVGEVGLGGEVRRVPGIERRLREAARLGFSTAIVPRGEWNAPPSLDIVCAAHIGAALAAVSARASRESTPVATH
jgi:DNA repair protein RadA/Sms